MHLRGLWLAPVFGALMLACPKDDVGPRATAPDASADGDAPAPGLDASTADGCTYRITKSPIVLGEARTVNVLNELGQVGGRDGQGRPFIWSEGKEPYYFAEYFDDPTAAAGEVFDLDDQGRAVGVLENVSKPDAIGQKCDTFDCGMVWLPPGPKPGPNQWWPGWNLVHAYCAEEGATSVAGSPARAISKNGDIVVGANGCVTPPNVTFAPGLGTLPLYLATECGSGLISDVNNDFMVVGSCTLDGSASGEIRGLRGKGDAKKILPSLGGTVSNARRLNASAIAAGMSTRPDGSTAAVYWNAKDELLELPGAAIVKDGLVNDEAHDINDSNLIVGHVTIHPDAQSLWHVAAAWKDGTLIDLNAAACTRAPGKDINAPPYDEKVETTNYPQYVFEYALAVNNKGQVAVVGEDRTPGGARWELFLLTPR